MKFRTLIKELAPPIIIRLLKSLTKKNEKCFSGVYSSFDEVPDDKPWDSGFWIDISRDKLNKFNNVGNSNEFIPTDYLHRQRHLKLCQIVNMISQNEVCKILDFAGGTGFVYFLIKPYLTNIKNITWDVVDNTQVLTKMGIKAVSGTDPVSFHEKLPKTGTKFDLVYINTSLQYIENYKELFSTLLDYNPKYIVLTRLIAGNITTFVTEQNIHGKRTPCIFLNINDLIEYFQSQGYELMFKSACSEEVFSDTYNVNIPKSHRITNSLDVIFSRKN